MPQESSSLRAAFLDDHRRLTRGLLKLLDALKEDNPTAARAAANELDEIAGPHMEFEETVFYPTLERILGSDVIDQLSHEHAQGQDAVRAVLRRNADVPFRETERRILVEQMETALEHALSCGSLLSHLGNLDAATTRKMHEQLLELRMLKRRWTSLPGEARDR